MLLAFVLATGLVTGTLFVILKYPVDCTMILGCIVIIVFAYLIFSSLASLLK